MEVKVKVIPRHLIYKRKSTEKQHEIYELILKANRLIGKARLVNKYKTADKYLIAAKCLMLEIADQIIQLEKKDLPGGKCNNKNE